MIKSTNTKNWIRFTFVESGTGYDVHYLKDEKITTDDFKITWYCWYLSKEFIDALAKHGLPPTHIEDYD